MSFLAALPALTSAAATAYSAYQGGRGKKDKAKQFQQYSPEQMQGLQQLFQALQGGQGPYNDLFGEFNPQRSADVFQRGVAEPAMRNFQQRIQPQIMQAFADQGASSGLANSLAYAGGNLQKDLSSQLENFMNQDRLQNLQRRFQGLGLGFGAQPFQTYVQQGNPSAFSSMFSGSGNSFGQGGLQNLLQFFANQNGNSGNQFPLTNQYDQSFRSGAAY